MVLKTKVTVKNKTGIHTQPAGVLVKAARKYQCNIILAHQDHLINMKGILELVAANIKGDTEVEIICDGIDEQDALNEIKSLLTKSF